MKSDPVCLVSILWIFIPTKFLSRGTLVIFQAFPHLFQLCSKLSYKIRTDAVISCYVFSFSLEALLKLCNLMQLETVLGFCDPNPTEYVDHDVAEPNTVFYWGLLPNESIFIDTDSVKEDFMKSVNKDLYGDKSTRCKLELSIVKFAQLPKCVHIDSGVTKGSKACWRILDYSHLRKPVYSQYLPQYFVGYVASDRGYQSGVG